jgi:heavy metal sensor kinase
VSGYLSWNFHPAKPLLGVVWNKPPLNAPPSRGPITPELVRELTNVVQRTHPPKIDPDGLRGEEDRGPQYFQVDTIWGTSYESESLKKAGLRLPLDPAGFAPDEALHVEFEDTRLASGRPVRRVILKTQPVRYIPFWWPRPPRHGRRGPDGPGGRDPRLAGSTDPRSDRPPIFIQCASDTTERDANLQAIAERRDQDLADLETETADSLRALRNRLLIMSLVTFAATVLGCFWLVRLGLTPLARLSDAVSKVSEKDFHLPVDGRKLPRELHPIVERLKATLDLLQRAFAREKQATADISHDLRTPLAVLLTSTEVALRKPRTAEEYRETIEDCRLSAKQMNQAVERLLTLARLDAGVDVVRPQTVDVAELAGQCVAVVRPLAEARGLTLTVQSEEGLAPVQIDPDKLREVLTNLLHNAIQYNRPEGAIEVAVARKNGHVEVAVRDTGIGMAPEALGHVFERFYRVDRSRGSDGLHTGLGLAIVKEYVDLMGGSITVESTEGQGSTFRALFPVR